MAIQAQAAPQRSFRLDLDHSEQLINAVSVLSIPPSKNILYYFFPFLKAISSSYTEIRSNDPTQSAMMPEAPKAAILREIEELTHLAGIKRKVTPYAALNFHFSNCGGALSCTSPALFIPHHHLFRPDKSPFTQEQADERLDLETWRFSDHETRFLICRELAQIKRNHVLIRAAIKVTLLAAVFVFYTAFLGLLGALVLIIIAIALYIFSERAFSSRFDRDAIDLLAKRLDNNRPAAIQIAIQTLEKICKQNLARREQNKLCKLYITKKGNNILDFSHRFLTTRIELIKKI